MADGLLVGRNTVGLTVELAIRLLGVVVDDGRVGVTVGVAVRLLNLLAVLGVTGVGGVDVSLETFTVAGVALHDLLVLVESLNHLLLGNVVDEDARSKRRGNGSTELAVTGLQDSCGSGLEKLGIELVVVHGETDGGEETEDTLVVGIGHEATDVGKGSGVGHVDGDGMSVAEGSFGNELVKRRPAGGH